MGMKTIGSLDIPEPNRIVTNALVRIQGELQDNVYYGRHVHMNVYNDRAYFEVKEEENDGQPSEEGPEAG